ncbi:alpha-hydroxy acid oxidase [Ornithinimicrobium cavernae]|uniref:alpha-hydroxy acid oxidase n=1 Tax=Ornithinimicrobium cavernae TaxID=2666047 RepID=UPI000D696669|nr:alpha-hydroxy acid oxidase [Ornithinimicrobium cavernae]
MCALRTTTASRSLDRPDADPTAEHPASAPARPRRRLPRWSELKPLVQLEPVDVRPGRRRLQRAATVTDLREAAARRVPRPVFEFVDGGAEAEITQRRARAAFEGLEFRPRMLGGVDGVDTSTSLFGQQLSLPLVLGPTGFCRLVQHEGETAVARAAGAAGIPFALTTMGTVSIEDVAAAGGAGGNHWFQLYVLRDRGLTRELVQRAKAAGYGALVVTVDTAVIGQRLRDVRNGFSIPPRLTPRALVDIAARPAWWANLLTTAPLGFATIPAGQPEAHGAFIDNAFDPTISYRDLETLREMWDGPLIIKGVQRVDDAVRAADAGADGIVLSAHGGRQLDRSPVPLELLPQVTEAVGDRLDILLDSGVRSGADVAAAVALGARACLVGRPYLYGLMAGGQAGVEKTIQIFRDELRRTMSLLGCSTVGDLTPDLVRLNSHPPLAP